MPAAAYVIAWARREVPRQIGGRIRRGALFTVTGSLVIFAGGSRLYHHYFMAAYPGLCLVAALAIDGNIGRAAGLVRRRLAILIIIPALFFLAWNAKDAVIRNFFPQAFYNEGKALYWARAALVGHFNDYLLPESSYRGAAEYIERVTQPGDRIFVWATDRILLFRAAADGCAAPVAERQGDHIRSLYRPTTANRGPPLKKERSISWRDGPQQRGALHRHLKTAYGIHLPVTPLLREVRGREL